MIIMNASPMYDIYIYDYNECVSYVCMIYIYDYNECVSYV